MTALTTPEVPYIRFDMNLEETREAIRRQSDLIASRSGFMSGLYFNAPCSGDKEYDLQHMMELRWWAEYLEEKRAA